MRGLKSLVFFVCLFVNENWVEARTGGEINGDNPDENRSY